MDEQYMKLALALAAKGCGFVSPNPMVGAVIVKNGKIIGQGFHEKYGGPHAERNALASCAISPKEATLYVTLEPCCHFGKTPPCTEAILESGIRRVVVGHRDPNPLVSGKGIGILLEQGLEVTEEVLSEECGKLNEVFFHYIRTGTPYVVMKYAMTADGKTAAYTGESKWITGEAARRHVHETRHRYSAIMTGTGTVIKDDPLLTCRLENGKNPVRIICDTKLQTPLHSQIVETAKTIPTIIATTCEEDKKQDPYLKKGCQVITVPRSGVHVDLRRLMVLLGKQKIDSILLEGGGTLNWSALQGGIVNKVQAYISPKILGGAHAFSPVGGLGVDEPGKAFILKNSTISRFDEDILIESEVSRSCLQEL